MIVLAGVAGVEQAARNAGYAIKHLSLPGVPMLPQNKQMWSHLPFWNQWLTASAIIKAGNPISAEEMLIDKGTTANAVSA